MSYIGFIGNIGAISGLQITLQWVFSSILWCAVHCTIRNYKQQINKYIIKLINSGIHFNFPADNTVNVSAD